MMDTSDWLPYRCVVIDLGKSNNLPPTTASHFSHPSKARAIYAIRSFQIGSAIGTCKVLRIEMIGIISSEVMVVFGFILAL
jgi:hypothetical protein